MQTYPSPPILVFALAFVQAAPALLAASAGITAVVAISREVAANRVAPRPSCFSELRTIILLKK